MAEPLENLYFNWLYAKVCDVRTTSKKKQFEVLLQELHRTEYVWLLSGDDNRAEDGCELRDEFLTASNIEVYDGWGEDGCSALEMLVAFSRRAGFETSDIPSKWFWVMLENLGLSGLSDSTNPNRDDIQAILEVFLWRRYNALGHGGLFPLRETEYDQRYVEIWYQFNEYLYQNNIM